MGNVPVIIKELSMDQNDGTKLPPMLIFKRKTFPKEVIPRGVVVHVHEKGWMDENGMRVWVEK
ncbi:Pogo transposable element with KRAB domain, partial [Varanus komodoensis]